MGNGARIAVARRLQLMAILCAPLLLSGCAVRSANPWTPPPLARPEPQPIFYVTDRATITPTKKCRAGEQLSQQPMYGFGEADSLIYGTFSVVPAAAKRIGDIPRFQPRPVCLRTPEHPIFRTGPSPLDQPLFFAALKQALSDSERKDVLVFVHGYNFEFDEAALWTAQLRHYLGFAGPVVLYSWASRGERLGYKSDEQAIARSTPRLQAFLQELSTSAGPVSVHLLAHSMGSRAVLGALNRIGSERPGQPPLFRQLILAAPDIDANEFRKLAEPALKAAERTTLYVSTRDRALIASGHYHGYARAGDASRELVLLPGVDTVDVTPVDRSRIHHNYYLENRWVLADMYELLRDNTPPSQRFGLVAVRLSSGTLWQFRR